MLCPFATNRTAGVPNRTKKGMREHRGLVLHIMEGTLDGTDAWFHNPSSQVSAHFGVGKSGQLRQWVDTDDRAWAEAAGNSSWLSVEIEGHSGDHLTTAQVQALGRLYGWLEQHYHFGFALANSPQASGLGFHAMGGSAWGGHYDCPGKPIIAARPAIISAANPPKSTPSPLWFGKSFGDRKNTRGPVKLLLVQQDEYVKRINEFFGFNPTSLYTANTAAACRAWQAKRGIKPTGIFGKREWERAGL